MTREEISHYAIQAVTRAMLREDFTAKLGKIEYSITKYQRLIRALIPFEYENNRIRHRQFHIGLPKENAPDMPVKPPNELLCPIADS